MLHKIYQKVLGTSFKPASNIYEELSEETLQVIDEAFEPFSAENRVVDMHLHVGGTGSNDSGCKVHPHFMSPWHPFRWIRFEEVCSASGVSDTSRYEEQYMNRLIDLESNIRKKYGRKWGKSYLLALDKRYNEDGTVNEEFTGIYVPNEFVFELSQKHREYFYPAVSIHPYRTDALEELDKWGNLGVKMVKWLPNIQGIDPSHDLCDLFYEKMKQYGMMLLIHLGSEHSLDVPGTNHSLANPLLLRKPLDIGVKIIGAHIASSGMSIDLDNGSSWWKPTMAPNFDLFMRLMNDPKYSNLLYGDISSLSLVLRLPRPLATILERDDLHHRLFFGTDYPLPAISLLTQTELMVQLGFLDEEDRRKVNPIYYYNPILFDFVLKRVVKSPVSGKKFHPIVFMNDPALISGKEQLPLESAPKGLESK